MKNLKFFAVFALVLGAMVLTTGCVNPVSTSSTGDTSGYYKITTQDGGDEFANYLAKETVSDSGKIDISLSISPVTAKVRYVLSNTKNNSDYPSSIENSRNCFLDQNGAGKISGVTTRYVLFAFFADGHIDFSNADFGYWEVENYSPTVSKLDVTFAQSGQSLTISAVAGSLSVPTSVVHYTIDGSDPTVSSPLSITGSQAITVSSGITVKAKAFAPNSSYTDSDVKSYTMTTTTSSTTTTATTTTSDKYFYIDTSFKGASIKITFEDSAPGVSGMYVVGTDGKVPVVVSGNPKISISLVTTAGKWCDANGVEGAWSQSSVWSGDTVTLVSYQNGGMTPTGRSTTWTRK